MSDNLSHPNSPEACGSASLIHPLTNLKTHLEKGALVIEEGDGVRVTDIHGKNYIEGMSGLWCLALGYGQERLVKAAAEKMRRVLYYHSTNHKSHQPAIDLAEKLLEIAPVPMSKV
jgi:4-aminobutyrate--pyruvate transaminase